MYPKQYDYEPKEITMDSSDWSKDKDVNRMPESVNKCCDTCKRLSDMQCDPITRFGLDCRNNDYKSWIISYSSVIFLLQEANQRIGELIRLNEDLVKASEDIYCEQQETIKKMVEALNEVQCRIYNPQKDTVVCIYCGSEVDKPHLKHCIIDEALKLAQYDDKGGNK